MIVAYIDAYKHQFGVEPICRVYGARKMWHALRREGESVVRDQVARVMRSAGLRGAAGSV